MNSTDNPFEPPSQAVGAQATTENRQLGRSISLLSVCLLQGIVTAFFSASLFMGDVSFFFKLTLAQYQSTHLILFFLISWFFIIETIGPWFGIYHLALHISNKQSFNRAQFQALKHAGGISSIITLLLSLLCAICSDN